MGSRKNTIFFVSVILAALAPGLVWAYPSTIGHGYPSCATCHFNPLGNGPLRDYGRSVGASTLADRILTPEKTDEEMGETAGFLGPIEELPPWFRPSFDFRGMLLNSGMTTNVTSRFIPMQLEASAVLQFDANTNSENSGREFFVSGTFGYAPVPAATAPALIPTISTWISREHYVAYRFNKAWGLYAGLMDPAFGIRIPDHSAFIRSQALFNHNDQIHSLMAHHLAKTWELAFQVSAGNLLQAADVRFSGVGAQADVELAERVRVGAALRYGKNSYRSTVLGDVHARLGFAEADSLLSELALVQNTPVSGSVTTGLIAFLQPAFALRRGLKFQPTVEYYVADISGGTQTFRAGPGLEWMPVPRFEIRTDLQFSYQRAGAMSAMLAANLMTQVHLFF